MGHLLNKILILSILIYNCGKPVVGVKNSSVTEIRKKLIEQRNVVFQLSLFSTYPTVNKDMALTTSITTCYILQAYRISTH